MKILNHVVICLSLLTTVAFSSCVNNPWGDEPRSVEDLVVPENFSWSTLDSVSISVIPYDTFDGEYYYTIEVFGGNPVLDKTAPLLAKGVARTGRNFTSAIIYPASLTKLYIRQTDPVKKQTVQSVALTGASLVCNFNPITTESDLSGMLEKPSMASKVVANPYATPSDATAISGTGDVSFSENTNYVILEGTSYSGKIKKFDDGAKLYVEGTYTRSSNSCKVLNDENSWIVVQSTGTFNGTVSYTFSAGTIINKGSAQFTNITFSSSASLVNQGSMVVSSTMSCNSASNNLSNTGIIQVDGTLSLTNGTFHNDALITTNTFYMNGSSFINNGSLTANTVDLRSNAMLYNNCSIETHTLTTNGPTLFLYDGSRFNATNASFAGCTVNFEDGAILETTSSTFTSYSSNFNGVGSSYSLFIAPSITLAWGSITFSDQIEIVTSQTGLNSNYYSEVGNVRWSDAANSTTIEATDCNDGGNNVGTGGETPSDPEFPIEVPLFENYTYMMEDLWPSLGDYDMNDIVTSISVIYLQDEDNLVESMRVAYTLRAVGATYKIAAAIQLDNVTAAEVSSVSHKTNVLTGTVFSTEAGGVETGQTKAVIPLFDDAHSWLNGPDGTMLNTVIGQHYYTPVSDTVSLSFVSAINPNLISISGLNFFIVTNGNTSEQRTEIHLRGFEPTDKANTILFGTSDDNSSFGVKYTTVENFVWGILIPEAIDYPAETKSIISAYPEFAGWCTSGGTENTSWYESPSQTSGLIYLEP